MQCKFVKRLVTALAIGFGPLLGAMALFLVTSVPGDANGGAGFYLAAALVVTPFF